jgi:hypothetical protein
MKVLDLQCGQQHVFEGWFGSEDDFQDQLKRGLVQCPLCSDATISKRLSAPRLNLGGARDKSVAEAREQADESSRDKSSEPSREGSREEPTAARQDLVAGPQADPALAAAWMAIAKRIIASTDDVGDKFAEEARKIHYGETKERSIRGKASADETQALLEEGIAVLPMLLPEALKGRLQ